MRKNSWPGVALLLILAALGIGYYLNHRSKAGSSSGSVSGPAGPVSGKLVIRFLDIKQGDSELIQLADGETILIDSGDRGAPTVELLKKYGVKEIALAIATHPHSDHIGEMRNVLRAFKVHEFWDSGFNHSTVTYANMLQEIKGQGIKFSTPKQGESRKFGDVLIEV